MTAIDVAAAVAVLAGALLQSAVGFGFALVAAPLVLAATAPEQAIGLLLVTGFELNMLTLLGERRRPEPLRRTTLVVLACAVPGMAVGLVILHAVDKTTLQIGVTVAVFAGLALQSWARRHVTTRPAPAWAPPAAGFTSGVLALSTSTSGPPLILLLRGRGHAPERIRDTLTAIFVGMGVLGATALVVSDTDAAMPEAAWAAALIPLVAVGQWLGRPLFARLAGGSYEAVLTAVLAASAVGALLVALL